MISPRHLDKMTLSCVSVGTLPNMMDMGKLLAFWNHHQYYLSHFPQLGKQSLGLDWQHQHQALYLIRIRLSHISGYSTSNDAMVIDDI